MARTRPRILHTLAPAMVGGLERVVETLSMLQARRGQPVGVAAILTAGATEPLMLTRLRDAGVDVRLVATSPRAYRQQVSELSEAVRASGAQVIHSHGYHADILSAVVGRGARVPIVSTVHGFTGGSAKNRLYEWLMVRAHRRFDAVVAVSRPIAQRLIRAGVPPATVRVIRNGFVGGTVSAVEKADPANSPTTSTREAVWVGRVSWEKGLDVMVRALPLLADLGVRLTVIGDGPEVGAVRQLAVDLNVESRVRWLGSVPLAGELIAHYEVFVLSSRTEGTPITLLEAMNARTPIVATAVGGVPDVVSEETAHVVPPESPQALATAIRDVFIHPDHARTRAEAASARLAAEFAPDPWVDAYSEVYQRIAHLT